MANEISLQDYYRRSPAIVSRRIADEAVLVPLRQKSSELDNIYSLNDTAARTWELLDGQRSLQTVIQSIVTEYAIGEAQASADLLALVSQLVEIGALEKV